MRSEHPNLKPQPPEPGPAAPRGAVDLAPDAVAAGDGCVHCGLCLPACPTYVETGDEARSPRGRIRLMLGMHRGDVAPTPGVRDDLDTCLNCRACETACPSGVTYHTLLEDTRRKMHEAGLDRRGVGGRFARAFLNRVMTHPDRLRWALLPARLAQKTGLLAVARALGLTKLLPGPLGRMERLLGDGPLWPTPLPELSRGDGVGSLMRSINPALDRTKPRRPRVGFLAGCVGDAMYAQVNRKAVELLCAAGADVVVPRSVRCCGAIPHHNADEEQAKQLARTLIDAYLPTDGEPAEVICTCIAGCGAMMREVAELLADDDAYAERASAYAARVRDVSEVLLMLGVPEAKHAVSRRVAYHPACHLRHAQGVAGEPLEMLAGIPGLELVEPADAELCCGAAGSYNLDHPATADDLGRRKLAALDATGATIHATGNVGCAMHLSAIARDAEETRTIVHPVELLHEAVFGNA